MHLLNQWYVVTDCLPLLFVPFAGLYYSELVYVISCFRHIQYVRLVACYY